MTTVRIKSVTERHAMRKFVGAILIMNLVAGFSTMFGCTRGCLSWAGFDEDPTFDETRASLMSDLETEECNGEETFPFAVAGECDDQDTGERLLFLADSNGFSFEIRYFDSDSERIIAQRSAGDVIDPFCYGQSYWPRHVNCDNGIVTEVLCGTRYEVGDDYPEE